MKRQPLIIVGAALALVAGAAIASSAARAARLNEVPVPSFSSPSASASAQASSSDSSPASSAQSSAAATDEAGNRATTAAPGHDADADQSMSSVPQTTAPQEPVVEPQPPSADRFSTIPAAVAASQTGAVTDQVVAVVATGSTAQVHLLNRRAPGSWDDEWAETGAVGPSGLGRSGPGSAAAPVGSWPLTSALGLTSDGGSLLPYKQINEQSCWVLDKADPGRGSLDQRDSCASPNVRLANSPDEFRYALTIGGAATGGSGAQAVSFVHVADASGHIAGVALPQSAVTRLMREVRPGAHIVIANSIQELATY